MWVLHVLETNRDSMNLPMEQREVELQKIELLWMDRLMSEYPGMTTKRDMSTTNSDKFT